MPHASSTYAPPPLLAGGHVQTLAASLLRRVDFAYARRLRLDTPDGDFLDVDAAFADGPDAPARRLAVVTHGLEGSAAATYARGMARALTRAGWDVLALNLRGCSGTLNRRPRFYHSGATEDLAVAVDYALTARAPDALALVGFSLGGNLTLKYLGERAGRLDPRVCGAACFSVPVDLAASAAHISRLANVHYTLYFLRRLRAKVRAKHRQFPDAVPLAPLRQAWTLPAFDDAYTAPLHGFADAADYYRQASSRPLLPHLDVPTLLVNARNDPFLPPACYPVAEAAASDALTLETPASGGHVGFVTLGAPDGAYWSERRATAFLADAAARA